MTSSATRIGRYELVARLAAGGMGEIFLARLEGAAGFEKLYAVKRILPHLASDPRFRKMLIAEAQIAARMTHPNICQVYELGDHDGQLFIVMEYLEGVSLLPLLRRCSRERTPLDLGMVASVFGQMCDALHYAHELTDRSGKSLGVIHRDVTPANVFVTEGGNAKVLDFGIAKTSDAQATQTGTVKGKYAYMAPEQLRGGPASRGFDVFALGVVLFEMLALRRLFQRSTDFLTFSAVMEQPIADLRRYRPDVPAGVVDAINRALARDPTKRTATVRELRDAVLGALPAPWSVDEVGAWVRERFASELGATQTAVARAIDRSQAGADWMASEPPIAPDDAVHAEEDTQFPPVELDDDGAPVSGIPLTPVPGGAAAVAAVSVEKRLPPAPRRSRLPWLVLALLVVGGAGAAAFALWPRGQSASVTTTDAPSCVEPSEGSNQKAVLARGADLGVCTAKHATEHGATTASILIAADGRAQSISYTPAIEPDLDTCLTGVLQSVAFPARCEAGVFALEITLPVRRRRAR